MMLAPAHPTEDTMVDIHPRPAPSAPPGRGKAKGSAAKLEKQLVVAAATIDELDAQVTALRARVEMLEGQVDHWKRRAAKHKSRLKKITDRAEPAALRDAPELPDASWNVTRLRAAAREQGVPRYSRMSRQELLDVLI
jgi:predicted RNase H-like nuclease (RuvC/YqgF family)